jgi:predicted ArsR family transcriptional regulator
MRDTRSQILDFIRTRTLRNEWTTTRRICTSFGITVPKAREHIDALVAEGRLEARAEGIRARIEGVTR